MATYFGSSVNPADGGSAAGVALTLTPPADMVEGQLVVITGIKRTSSLGEPFFSKTGGQDWRFFAEASASNANAVIGAVCIFNGTWTEAPELDLNTGAAVSAQMHVFSPASGKRFVIETCGAQVFGGGSSDMAVSPQALAGPSGIAIIAYHTQDDNQYSAPSTNWSNAGAQHYRNTSGVALACAYRTLNAPGSFGTCTVSQTTDGPDPGKALWLVAREVDAATEAEDDFNRADGSVGDDWSAILGSRGIIVNNQLTSSSGTQGAHYSAKAFRRAQFSEIEFVSGASGTFYVIVRFLPNFFRTGYSLGIDVAEDTWTLYNDDQIFTDSLITLDTGELPDPVTSGDVYRLEIDDEGILSVYQNDTLVTTFEDHTYTGGGQPGYAVPSTIILDNWRGGELESDEGIDGTLTATEAADSAAVTGAVLVSGSLAATENADTASVAGAVTIEATLGATEGADTAQVSASVLIAATLAATEAQDSALITSSAQVAGLLAATEAADTAQIAGLVLIKGALAATESADMAAISATTGSAVEGVLAASEAPDSMMLAGELGYWSGYTIDGRAEVHLSARGALTIYSDGSGAFYEIGNG